MKTKIEKTINGYESAVIMQDNENYFIDLRTGAGEAIYPKNSFSLDEAISAEVNFKME